MRSLSEALAGIEDPPCDVPDRCPRWAQCAATGETCQAFRQYQLFGEWNPATRGVNVLPNASE